VPTRQTHTGAKQRINVDPSFGGGIAWAVRFVTGSHCNVHVTY
jgi:hypothetical protein